jgi:hypothetical protein
MCHLSFFPENLRTSVRQHTKQCKQLHKSARNTKEEKMYWLHLNTVVQKFTTAFQATSETKHKHFQISSEGLDMGGDPILLTNI